MTARLNVATETPAARKRRAGRIDAALANTYPDAWCALVHRNPWELLVATIMSAQCTDKLVNTVTPALFAAYPTPAALAAASPADVERLIGKVTFFRQKTKSLLATAKIVAEQHGGEVPAEMDVLVTFPGAGRKTANVVLGTAFGQPAIFVDTHVKRLSNRLGLTVEDDPVKIERDLQAVLPPAQWTHFAHRLIHHGRLCCIARKPRCSTCSLAAECPRIGVDTSA